MIDSLVVPTLFKRKETPEGWEVIPELTEECNWAILEQGILITIKVDGYSCLVKDGLLKRKITKDIYTFCDKAYPADKPIVEAYDNTTKFKGKVWDGFYTAFGPNINNNPQQALEPFMVRVVPVDNSLIVTWGSLGLKPSPKISVEDLFNGLKAALADSAVAGFVFHLEKPVMNPIKFAQITRRDFGLEWPISATAS